jgi:hypothetical protein
VAVGYSADNLPPKWFTKDPGQPYEDEKREMLDVIRHACRVAVEAGERGSVFELWRDVYEGQKAWATEAGYPPLLWNFGVSLVERCLIDAWCRAAGMPFHEAVRSGALGGVKMDFLPAEPLRELTVRHTVGLTDPLTDEEIPGGEGLCDGLPQSLLASIRAYGLNHFKIKLSGDVNRDGARLRRLAELLGTECTAYAYTLDGNENFQSLDSLQSLWEPLVFEAVGCRYMNPHLFGFVASVIFVEQPLHRDVALSEDTGRQMREWEGRPRIIIDESDADLGTLERAIELGYAGTSHKNCKGVFKSLYNATRVALEQDALVLSAEDLTNVGPIALPQDLHVAATLGIGHLERNGQHYFRGLSVFPESVQGQVMAAHPDLYRMHERGFGTLDIRGGRIEVGSVVRGPFGTSVEPDLVGFKEV